MSPTDEPSNLREVQQRAWRRQQAWQGEDQNNIFRSSRNHDAWVHWEYSPEEWVLFDTIDWRSRHYTSLWLLVCLPSSLAFGYVLSRVGGSVAAVLAFVFLALLMFFFFWRIVLLGDARQRHLARQNQAQPHRITFSQRGVWEAGTYFPLNDRHRNIDLEEIKMTSEPPVLHFRLKTTSTTSEGDFSHHFMLRVLVPRGHEEEAAQLLQRFRTEVIEPRKQAQEQTQEQLNPPEPY